MKILRAHIENFKNIEKATIEFGHLTALIGKNNAGKSSVLQAIDLALGLIAGRIPDAWPDIERRYRRGHDAGPMSISLDIGVPAFLSAAMFSRNLAELVDDGTVGLRFKVDFNKGDLSFRLFGQNQEKEFQFNPLSRSSTGVDDLLSKIGVTGIGTVELGLGPLAEALRVPCLLSAGRRSEGRGDAKASNALDGDAHNLVAFLLTLLSQDRKAFGEVVSGVEEIVPEVLDLGTPLLDGASVHGRITDAAHPRISINWDDISDGAKQILQILSFSLSAPVVLIEEPELCLHSHAVVALIQVVSRIAGQRQKQVIISTHSPALIDSISFEQLRVVTRPLTGATEVRDMRDFAAVERQLRKFGVTLGPLLVSSGSGRASRSRAPFILVLEGRNDQLLWPKILERGGVDETDFQPVTGDNGWQNACAITAYIGFLKRVGMHDLDYLAVFDSDGNPEVRREEIRQRGLTDDEFEVLNEKEIESYLIDPDALAGVTGKTLAETEEAIKKTRGNGKEKLERVLRALGISCLDSGIMQAIVQQMKELPEDLRKVTDRISEALEGK